MNKNDLAVVRKLKQNKKIAFISGKFTYSSGSY